MNLFTPLFEDEKLHQNFKALLAEANGFKLDVINDWARGFPDRDKKFTQEFQTTFNSSLWELYLHAIFKRYGFTIDWNRPTPDFKITHPTQMIIEATVASNASDMPPEHTHARLPPSDLNKFNAEAITRLSNAISYKHKKHKEKYSTMSHVHGLPFIIAIHPFDQPYAHLACQRPIEALLYDHYVDEESLINNLENTSKIQPQHTPEIKKRNGSRIETGLFNNSKLADISAIIYSSCGTKGKISALSNDPRDNMKFTSLRLKHSSIFPTTETSHKSRYKETLLDGLRIYHNPFARSPTPKQTFQSHEVFQAYYNHKTDDWEYDQNEGILSVPRKVFAHFSRSQVAGGRILHGVWPKSPLVMCENFQTGTYYSEQHATFK